VKGEGTTMMRSNRELPGAVLIKNEYDNYYTSLFTLHFGHIKDA